MKVILKAKIKKLGNIGDIVDVADGYGKNMLIPNNLAIFYTDKNYEVFKIKKDEIEKQNLENKAKMEDLKSKILARELILIENAGDDGKLYGSINGVKLSKFVNSLLKIQDLKKNNVFLLDNIKEIGKYLIVFNLHPEVSFEKELIIARSKEEAIKIKKNEFKLEKNNKEELVQNITEEVEVKEEKKHKSKKKNENKEDKIEENK